MPPDRRRRSVALIGLMVLLTSYLYTNLVCAPYISFADLTMLSISVLKDLLTASSDIPGRQIWRLLTASRCARNMNIPKQALWIPPAFCFAPPPFGNDLMNHMTLRKERRRLFITTLRVQFDSLVILHPICQYLGGIAVTVLSIVNICRSIFEIA